MPVSQADGVSARAGRHHQSGLETLIDGCSWQWFLINKMGLATGDKPLAAVGSAYHSGIELHEKNRMVGVNTTLIQMCLEARKYLQENIQDESLLPECYEQVESALHNWYYRGHRDWLLQFRVIAIEPEFTQDFIEGHMPIGGYIDAVYQDIKTGTYFIVDHKTATRFDRWRDTESHMTQATMYSVALVLSEDYPEISELPEMVYMVSRIQYSTRQDFKATLVMRVQPNIEDVSRLADKIRKAESIINTESYTTNPSWAICSPKWCPFYQDCQVDKWLSTGTPDEIRDLLAPVE